MESSWNRATSQRRKKSGRGSIARSGDVKSDGGLQVTMVSYFLHGCCLDLKFEREQRSGINKVWKWKGKWCHYILISNIELENRREALRTMQRSVAVSGTLPSGKELVEQSSHLRCRCSPCSHFLSLHLILGSNFSLIFEVNLTWSGVVSQLQFLGLSRMQWSIGFWFLMSPVKDCLISRNKNHRNVAEAKRMFFYWVVPHYPRPGKVTNKRISW